MKVLALIAVLAAAASTGFASRVVCYYTNWSRYGGYSIEDINPKLCTHVVYAFFGLENNGSIKSADPWNDFGDDWNEGAISKFTGIRTLNPKVKLLLGVGGWSEAHVRFQAMFRNPRYRNNFINSTMSFLEQHKFDGIDINLVYQGDSVAPTDKKGISDLVKEMKPLYKAKGYLLSFATSGNAAIFKKAYDIPVLSSNVDFINMMSYDLHGYWDGKTGHVAPLHKMKGETPIFAELNVEAVVNRHLKAGADRAVLNIGLVGYARTFTLKDPKVNGVNAPVTGPGHEEPLPYRKFCEEMDTWKKCRIQEQKVPYAVKDDQWVGYEDAESLREKVKFNKREKLGGVTFWSLDQDDFAGNCGSSKYPLLSAVYDETNKP